MKRKKVVYRALVLLHNRGETSRRLIWRWVTNVNYANGNIAINVGMIILSIQPLIPTRGENLRPLISYLSRTGGNPRYTRRYNTLVAQILFSRWVVLVGLVTNLASLVLTLLAGHVTIIAALMSFIGVAGVVVSKAIVATITVVIIPALKAIPTAFMGWLVPRLLSKRFGKDKEDNREPVKSKQKSKNAEP